MTQTAYINRIAAFLPGEPVDNDHMEGVLGMIGGRPSRARRLILRRNGIKQRYYVLDPETGRPRWSNAELTAEAVRKLAGDGFELGDIGALACGTSSADQLAPGHGVMVHGELGNPGCEVVSLAGICVSGVAALKYAWMSVIAGQHASTVATGSENTSTYMTAQNFAMENEARVQALEENPEIAFEKDFLRWMLSDGAGAILLQDRPNPAGLSLRVDWIDIHSYADRLPVCMYAGGDKDEQGNFIPWRHYPSLAAAMQNSAFAVKQDVKLLNENVMPLTVRQGLIDSLERHPMRPDEVDWFLPHYSSEFFRQQVYDNLAAAGFEIPHEKWFTNLSEVGNVGSASPYLMLEALFNSGRLQPGQTLLCYIPESGRFSTAFMRFTVVGQ
ncbi:MAG: beta-ketoacyl-ACP synthase III [Gammaproteobacteria bacterium]|jgi:3-oxoacyl-[acyl-carrier-protein] synthase-3